MPSVPLRLFRWTFNSKEMLHIIMIRCIDENLSAYYLTLGVLTKQKSTFDNKTLLVVVELVLNNISNLVSKLSFKFQNIFLKYTARST